MKIVAGILVGLQVVFAQSVIKSKHDLSSLNDGATQWQSTNEKQVCIFCHTPHTPQGSIRPLWNKANPTDAVFSMYTSPTLDVAANSDLSGSYSLMCLSCHDGSTPMNMLLNPSIVGQPEMAGGYTKLGDVYYPGSPFAQYPGANIGEGYGGIVGRDLTNDHPVNILYDASHPDVLRGDLFNPDASPSGLGGTVSEKLLFNKRLECPSCHDPHNPTEAPFLRKTTDMGLLCITCHNK